LGGVYGYGVGWLYCEEALPFYYDLDSCYAW
jgi:hypothetical protein